MGNTRELFKKIRATRGTFHAKMGIIKDRNSMDLIEAEDLFLYFFIYFSISSKEFLPTVVDMMII